MIMKAPTPFNGIRCGVRFENGVGECETEHIIYWFKTHGYTAEGGNTTSTNKPTNTVRKGKRTTKKTED